MKPAFLDQADPRSGIKDRSSPVRWESGSLVRSVDPGTSSMKTLAQLKPGERSRIVGIDPRDPEAMRKVLCLGIMPGERIELIRRSPAVVFAMGGSQFALDRELASCILVE